MADPTKSGPTKIPSFPSGGQGKPASISNAPVPRKGNYPGADVTARKGNYPGNQY